MLGFESECLLQCLVHDNCRGYIQEMMGHLFKGGCMHHFETLLYIPSEYVVDQTVYVFLVIAYEL